MEKKKSIGALWEKTSKSGTKYFSGVFESGDQKTNIVIFQNSRKEKDNQPDWQIFLSEPKPQQ